MSTQGIILIDLIGLGLIVLILNLVRTHTLHAGYAAVWLLAVAALMIMISIPPLLAALTVAVGATYPASALSLLAFIFIFVMLVFFSVQLTILSTRQVKLIQALALRELRETAQAAPDDDPDAIGAESQPVANLTSNG
jgi:ABC-type transport system involved in multi-copper enzyme maturation permease subunit